MRSVAPTRLGIEMSQKIWLLSSVKPAVRHQDDDDAPELPDHESEEFGEDRPDEVPLGDRAPRTLPLREVLGIPSVDPASAAVDQACLSGAAVVPTAASGVVPAGGAVSVASVIVISWGVASEVELVIPKLRMVRFAVSCAV